MTELHRHYVNCMLTRNKLHHHSYASCWDTLEHAQDEIHSNHNIVGFAKKCSIF